MVSKAAVLDSTRCGIPRSTTSCSHLLSGDVVVDEHHLALALAEPGNDGRDRLRRRLEDLAIMDWDEWPGPGGREAIVAERPRATVLDLGGFQHPGEPRAAALALLDNLWRNREERRPILIVIDAAHNLYSPNPVTPLETVLTERIIQIAAEGRKYGLWLLLSTQRPSKIHPNVLSQCDNLGLMKMSAPRDLAELGEYFGYAPPDLLGASPRFAQGEVLFAGGHPRTVSHQGLRAADGRGRHRRQGPGVAVGQAEAAPSCSR